MKLKKSLFKHVFPEATVEARLALIRFEVELPPEDLVTAIFVLTHDSEPEVSEKARDGFWDIPEDTMMEALTKELTSEVIIYVGKNFPFSEKMVEMIAINDEINDEVIEAILGVCTHDTIEVFFGNEKILGRPNLYKALRGNLNVTSDLIISAEEQLAAMELGGEEYAYQPEDDMSEDDIFEALIGESVDLDEDLIEEYDDSVEALTEEYDDPDEALIEESEDLDDALTKVHEDSVEALTEGYDDSVEDSDEEYDDSEEEMSQGVYQMIQNMTVGDKIKLALTGNKEVRGVLLKQSNKVVSRSVVRNPKITNNEIAQLTQTRSVSDEILREIARNDEWLKNYGIRKGLAFNPKTPVQISLKLLTKLNVKDLVALSISKGVPNVITASAKKIVTRKKNN